MRRLALLAVPLLALNLACGGGGKTTGGGSPAPSPLTEAQLQAALLTAADLGAGWTQAAEESEEPSESPAATPTGDECDLDQDFGAADRVADADVSLENSEQGGFLSQEVESYKPGKAAAALAEGRRLLDKCGTLSDAEAGLSLQLTEWTGLPALGDEALARKLSATSQGNTIRGGMIVFRKGDVLVAVFGISVTGSPDEFVLTAAQRAATKVPQ